MSSNFFNFQNVKVDVENSNLSEIHYMVQNGHREVEQANLTSMTNVYISTDDRTNTQSDNNNSCGKNKEPCSKSRFTNIEEGLESSLGEDAKDRIARIVSDVKGLSDVEKLLLYLKLPSGDTVSDELRQTPTSCLHVSNRIEQAQAYTWIKSHLEEDIEICLPKQEVYEDYKLYCDNHGLKPLSTADFGKVMKCVFPNVKPRRLGQRGQSRYCYGGLRKKLDVGPPQLPELEISPRKQQQDQKDDDDELFSASCTLVCEWAQKLLGNSFSTVRELAEFLVGNLYVNSKSVAAFTLIAGMQEAGIQNQKVSSLFSNTTGGDRHRETQLQLQRKLQERELVREQKRKIQQQKEENEQQMKMALDRQTPLIFSPNLQQESGTSPARRIFDDEGTQLPDDTTFDAIRSKSVVCVGNMSSPLPRNSRSKSVVSDNEIKKSANQNKKDETENVSQELMDTSETTNISSLQTETQSNNNGRQEKQQGQGQSKDMCVDKNSTVNTMTDNVCDGHSSPFYTVKKPSFVVFGSLNIPKKDDDQPSFSNISVPPHIISQQSDNVETQKDDTSLSFYSSNDCTNIIVSEFKGKDSSSKDTSLFLNPSTVSSRSAFVPFSQVQCRKDATDDTIVKIPSTAIPSVEMIELNNKNQVLKVNKQILNEQINLQSTNSSEVSSPGKPVLVINSVPSSISSSESRPVAESESSIKLAEQNIPVSISTSFDKAKSLSVTLPSSETQFSHPLLTSPSKKTTKSRFTPIRPKASPNKTVSSILKEQKALNVEAPAYDTRPVATLLKEKRAREAEALQQKNKPVGQVSAISLTQSIQPPGIGNFGTVQNQHSNLISAVSPGAAGDFVIILNAPQPFNQGVVSSAGQTTVPADKSPKEAVSSAGQNVVSANTTTTVSMTTSTCRPIMHTVSSGSQRFHRVRTNSSSERELDSPMPMSQDSLNTSDLSEGYTSATDEEKPSKMAKIVDSDQNVSSRPGSRCSPDRETPSFTGRKRKFFNVGGNVHSRKRINSVDDDDDDVIFYDQKDNNRDPRRTRSCTFDIDDQDVKMKSNLISNVESVHCPDISSLESDALLDNADNLHLLSNSSNKDMLMQQVHSTAVGVNALSLRQSQQQLLKQKQMLDERMKSFLHGHENSGISADVCKKSTQGSCHEIKSDGYEAGISFDRHRTNLQLNEETENAGEEIPPDVVDFITEKMTGISSSSVNEHNQKHSTLIEMNKTSEALVEVDFSESQVKVYNRKIMSGNNSDGSNINKANAKIMVDSSKCDVISEKNLDEHMINVASRTYLPPGYLQTDVPKRNSGQSEKSSQFEIPSVGNQNQVKNFVSPQAPARRQRTPSVEKISNQASLNFANTAQSSQRNREASVESQGAPSFQRNREASVESQGKQTPSADAGYFSIGSSPVLNSTPVSGVTTCDNQVMRNPSIILAPRADSAQSLASDIVLQSPIPQSSPRFHTSTPLLMRSPCPTPSQGMLLSPTDSNGPNGQLAAFVPIQGSTFKINSNVTLIKPVVTMASGQSSVSGQITQDLIGIESIQPEKREVSLSKSPPSYKAALKSIQADPTHLNVGQNGAFVGKLPLYTNKSDKVESRNVGNKMNSPNIPVVKEADKIPQSNLPFSKYMALLSRKAQEDQKSNNIDPKNNNLLGEQKEHLKDSVEKDMFEFTDDTASNKIVESSGVLLSERGTVNWTGQNTVSAEAKKILSQGNLHTSQEKPNIESILSLLKSYENLSNKIPDVQTSINSTISSMHLTTLPSSHYIGNAPNINLATMLPPKEKTHNNVNKIMIPVDDVEFSARRNLTDLLSEHTSDINEEELESTLDVLRSVDSQYFGQDDLEFEYSKRQ